MNFDAYTDGCEKTESRKTTLPSGYTVPYVQDILEHGIAAGVVAGDCKKTIFYREDDSGSVRIDVDRMRQLHAILGVIDEAGELAQAFTKCMDGEGLDVVNLGEEVGDLMYYVSMLLSASGLDFVSVLNANLLKLQTRYGDSFSADAATNRDREKERQTLESEVR